MNRMNAFGKIAVLAVGLCCVQGYAQTFYKLTNSVSGTESIFTNSAGTSSQTGALITFEGELTSAIRVTNLYNAASGLSLASLQLFSVVRLFDELPASNDVGDVQGAVAALRTNSTEGVYFAWGISNNVATWLQLTNAETKASMAVMDGETNYVTAVFNYPTNGTKVSYRVYIMDWDRTSTQQSEFVTSPTSLTNGLYSVSLMGMGGLLGFGSASGSPRPLSSSIEFSVYATTNGVRIEINTVNENGKSAITVYAFINGAWVPVGTVPADQVRGEGDGRYFVYATGLQVGQSYLFKIVDEANNTHYSETPVEVKAIRMEAVQLTLDTMRVTFNSESGRTYKVVVSDDLAAPLGEWKTEYVSIYDVETGSWASNLLEFTAGSGAQTTVLVPVKATPSGRGFFKVILVDK